MSVPPWTPEPLHFPLKLDNPTLKEFVEYVLSEATHKTANSLFDQLIAESDEYRRLADDRTLMVFLYETLLADDHVKRQQRDYRFTFSDLAKFNKISPWRRKQRLLQVEQAKAERKKAHDAYEMYRKLCFTAPEGLVFKLEFT